MDEVDVGLDVHLKNIQVTVMNMNGEIVKKKRIKTSKTGTRQILRASPAGTKVALESIGSCWSWIDFLGELKLEPLLAIPLRVKRRAEEFKIDRLRSGSLLSSFFGLIRVLL